MHASTLIAASLHSRQVGPGIASDSFDRAANPSIDRQFQIKAADSVVVRQSTNVLLQQRYGWRGYQTVSLPADQTADRMTLTAIEDDRTIGTITVGLDGSAGLSCNEAFADEIEGLRTSRPRVCEFTKLAIDPVAGTTRVLAGLFHVAYIVAHKLRKYDAVVMEVNPRHVRYYQRMLGGKILGGMRLNRSVNAPAVLLSIDFKHVASQIELLGGQPERAASDRSLYPLAFTADEEHGIINRLMLAQTPQSLAVS